ncbi:MAG: CDP-alcohol phosphatidyltransferase family protein [Candidatus Omnitrophica bacterium]|nr:CDP-alcohol phosphatidyltransferase family protein [Candidatus Omnitrophota bacterium]
MNFANKISLSRIFAIPFFIASLYYYCWFKDEIFRWFSLGIFLFTVITDFADGLAARIRKEKTSIGKILDPLADKLLLINAFVWLYYFRGCLPFKYRIPFVVVLIVISRDLIILLGVLILFLFKVEIDISPNIWGKLTTFSQMLTILLLLFDFKHTPLFWNLALVFTIASGLLYIKRGITALNIFDLGGKNGRSK